MRALAKRIAPFPVISYSQICRRVNSLKIDFGTVEQNLIVAGDDERAAVRGMLRRNKKSIKKVILMACMTAGIRSIYVSGTI